MAVEVRDVKAWPEKNGDSLFRQLNSSCDIFVQHMLSYVLSSYILQYFKLHAIIQGMLWWCPNVAGGVVVCVTNLHGVARRRRRWW